MVKKNWYFIILSKEIFKQGGTCELDFELTAVGQ